MDNSNNFTDILILIVLLFGGYLFDVIKKILAKNNASNTQNTPSEDSETNRQSDTIPSHHFSTKDVEDVEYQNDYWLPHEIEQDDLNEYISPLNNAPTLEVSSEGKSLRPGVQPIMADFGKIVRDTKTLQRISLHNRANEETTNAKHEPRLYLKTKSKNLLHAVMWKEILAAPQSLSQPFAMKHRR